MTQKIATCSYCGTRAALMLAGREQHALACAQCGAPLRDFKALKADPDAVSKPPKKAKRPKPPPHRLAPASDRDLRKVLTSRKSRKLQRKIAKKALSTLAPTLFD